MESRGKRVRKHRVESASADDSGFLFRSEQIEGTKTRTGTGLRAERTISGEQIEGNKTRTGTGLRAERTFPGDRLHEKYRPNDVAAVLGEGEHSTFMTHTLIPQLREACAQATPEFLTLASAQYTARDGFFYKDIQGMLRRVVPTPELQSLVLRTLHRASHHNSAKFIVGSLARKIKEPIIEIESLHRIPVMHGIWMLCRSTRPVRRRVSHMSSFLLRNL